MKETKEDWEMFGPNCLSWYGHRYKEHENYLVCEFCGNKLRIRRTSWISKFLGWK